MFDRPHFIVNPAAAGGRAAAWWRRAEPVLRRDIPDLKYTIAPDKSAITATLTQALDSGCRTIVGVGGDGTHHDIVNALVRTNRIQHCTYAPLPLGTGNDWCRTLSVPRHLVTWLKTMQEGREIDHRVGRIRMEGVPDRYFINVAGLAYDAEVVRRVESSKFKHRLTYPLLTAACLPGYRPPLLELTYDGQTVHDRFHTINVGIGRYNGGGMRLVPQADPTGPTVALTFATALPILRIAANGWRFFTNTIGKVAGVTTTHATEVYVVGATGVEADGEYLGEAPVRIDLLDACLRVRCGQIDY